MDFLYIDIPQTWLWFSIAFAAMLVTSLMMSHQAAGFLTRDGSLRKFSILDLQLPSSPNDIPNILGGIFRLPEGKIRYALKSLKNHLYIDFLYMPAVYGCIFLLCMHVSSKTVSIGHPWFAAFAWLQILAWIFDMIENIYLLTQIKERRTPPVPINNVPEKIHRIYISYKYMVLTKWMIALLGGICSLMVLLYFWITGKYNPDNLFYSIVIIVEIIAFIALSKYMSRKKNQ
ncbi:MAG: hypothetical protein ABI772_06995 [Bacteroidota bacterium]